MHRGGAGSPLGMLLIHGVVAGLFGCMVSLALPLGDQSALVEEWSLPDVLNTKSLPPGWLMQDKVQWREGRWVLTQRSGSAGSVWSPQLPLSALGEHSGAFTTEWTIRDTGGSEESFSGAMALWVVKDTGADMSHNDKKLYNGPAKFEGLQLVLDSSGPYGDSLRAQLNDGSEELTSESVSERQFASCLLQYQGASVPSTVRLSYNPADGHLLKVQVDNRVCFQTRKVKLWDATSQGQLRLGVTAVTPKDTTTGESLELLKWQTFRGMIAQSYIPNAKAMGQPAVVRKTINSQTGEESVRLRDILETRHGEVNNYELFKKLDRLEGKILANDLLQLDSRLDEIARVQAAVSAYVAHLRDVLETRHAGATPPTADFSQFTKVNEKLLQLLEEQDKIRTLAKQHEGGAVTNVHTTLAAWLVPFAAIMLGLAYYTFTIRQEIAKGKML